MNAYQFDPKRHCHTLESRPLVGTSSVLSILQKPLCFWASGLAVREFGCPDPKVLTKIKNGTATEKERVSLELAATEKLLEYRQMDSKAYMRLLDRAYRAHQTTLADKADAGTDLHSDCERFIKDEMQSKGAEAGSYPEKIRPLIDWSRQNVKRYHWSEGHCYSKTHWIGGISDAGYERSDGTLGILDFKSSRQVFVSQYVQLAGYDLQIAENGIFTANGERLAEPIKGISEYAVFPFGATEPAPSFYSGTEAMKQGFLSALYLYKLLPQS